MPNLSLPWMTILSLVPPTMRSLANMQTWYHRRSCPYGRVGQLPHLPLARRMPTPLHRLRSPKVRYANKRCRRRRGAARRTEECRERCCMLGCNMAHELINSWLNFQAADVVPCQMDERPTASPPVQRRRIHPRLPSAR
jgi:hypothetical protein